MRIKLRCMPGYRGLVPEPYPASNATPDWIKAMPSRADSETHGGTVATMKQCPPLLDAVREGIVFPLATDLHVRDGELSWDWDLPETPGADLTESPIGLHQDRVLLDGFLRLGHRPYRCSSTLASISASVKRLSAST